MNSARRFLCFALKPTSHPLSRPAYQSICGWFTHKPVQVVRLLFIYEFREMMDEADAILDGDEMTGRQAAIFIGFWMLITALIGIISYIVVFVIIGF